jgi:hypothetical protein
VLEKNWPEVGGLGPKLEEGLKRKLDPSSEITKPKQDHRDYLLAELRCAALRARLWQHDIEAVGLALKGGLIEPEQALELLQDCDALHLVGTEPRGLT